MSRQSPITVRVARRYLEAAEMPSYSGWTGQQLEDWHAQTPKPKSIYDRFPKPLRPFDWATPAPTAPGVIPKPWRVAHAAGAQVLLRNIFRDRQLYVDYALGSYRGREQLVVGLYDNRDPAEHSARIEALAKELESRHFRIRLKKRGSGRADLWIVDDIPKHVLGD